MNIFSKSYLKPWGVEVIEKYPLIFLEPDPHNVGWAKQTGVADIFKDYVNLRYGFECHEGWRNIIENIAKTGTELVIYLRAHGYPDAYIHSCIVKEKFGTLAWQESTNGLPELFGSLWRAYIVREEYLTGSLCEETGKSGLIRKKKTNGEIGWHRTLCTEKAIEFDYKLEDWEKEKNENKELNEKDKEVLCKATPEVIAEIEAHTGC